MSETAASDDVFVETETATGWTRYTDRECGARWTVPSDDAPAWCPGCGRPLFESGGERSEESDGGGA